MDRGFAVQRACMRQVRLALWGGARIYDAHTSMSTQALNSQRVQLGLQEILLNHSGLWEGLRERGAGLAAV